MSTAYLAEARTTSPVPVVASSVTYLLVEEGVPDVPSKAFFSSALGNLVPYFEVANVLGLTTSLALVEPVAVSASISACVASSTIPFDVVFASAAPAIAKSSAYFLSIIWLSVVKVGSESYSHMFALGRVIFPVIVVSSEVLTNWFKTVGALEKITVEPAGCENFY